MSRSGYNEGEGDYDYNAYGLWQGIVHRAVNGKRGQNFLKELAKEMDAMPVKKLIRDNLVTKEGNCCAVGVVCKARNLDVTQIDIFDAQDVGDLVGISRTLAAEIEWNNDDNSPDHETDEQRWVRMRTWVEKKIKP